MARGRTQPALDESAVRKAYRGWAPIYDYSFGLISAPGRRRAVAMLNGMQGRILELGTGTGLALPLYRSGLEITGIDLSPEMLAQARLCVRRLGSKQVTLALMDAGRLAFKSETFDAVAAMYVMTVVPDPAAVLSEIRRVLRRGGTFVCVNHFSREKGFRASAEKWLGRYSRQLGWHPVFPIDAVKRAPGFRLVEELDISPGGLFTLLRLEKID